MGQSSQGCKSCYGSASIVIMFCFRLTLRYVPACRGAKLRLPLTREDCTPYAAKQRQYSPEEETIIQSEVAKQF